MKRFSSLELRHLLISVLVMGFVVAYDKNFLITLFLFPFALIIIAPAFVLHEFGHKFAAQKYGFFAEYRMWTHGLLLAVFMALATTWLGSKFLFIAPGAVYFASRGMHASKEKIGKIGIAGVLVNLGLFSVFSILGLLSSNDILKWIGYSGAYVNAFLVIFNLIPFPPFDGQKVFSWDKKIWLLLLFIAVMAYLISGKIM